MKYEHFEWQATSNSIIGNNKLVITKKALNLANEMTFKLEFKYNKTR